jgi:hypothetical protein
MWHLLSATLAVLALFATSPYTYGPLNIAWD